MELSFTAGITIEQFYQSTLYEVLISLKGYGLRLTELWKMTRFQTYISYCSLTDPDKRVSIYSFLPLKGDPLSNNENELSEEQLMKIYQEGIQRFDQMEQSNETGKIQ